MKRAFENSCIKGCLVYVLGLGLILVLSATGLGRLNASLSAPHTSGPRSGTAAQPAPTSPVPPLDNSNTSPPAPVEGQSGASGSQPASAGQQEATPTAAPAPAPAPTIVLVAPPPDNGASASTPKVQAQGGEISGQATAPFYIVQHGDTLSSIAARFGVTTETLQAINKLDNPNDIWTNQLLYLPQQGEAPAQQGAQPAATPQPQPTAGSSGVVPPEMPRTGENAGP